MAGIQTLDSKTTSLQTLRRHWMFTFVRVQSEPLAAPIVAELTAFGPKWDACAKQETSLLDAILLGQANAVGADRGLNRIADLVSATIHGGKKPSVDNPVHQLYFGTSTPYEHKRPILGSQLEIQRSWPTLLAKASQPALQALAGQSTAAVDAADKADAALKAAFAEYDKFRLDGERKQLFDAYNALAAKCYGVLKGIAHDHPDLDLGGEWAESFYLHESKDPGPTTVAQASAAVAKLEEELAEARAVRDALLAKQQQKEAAAAAEAEAKAALAAAKKAAAEAAQKQKEAEAALKKAAKAKKS